MSLKILICGLGAIGLKHARLIRTHFGYEVFALRSRKEGNELNIPEFSSWEEADRKKFDVAFITNPTYRHLATALECARRNLHLFIEKPIDCTEEGLEALLKITTIQKLTAYIAYPLRFHPLLSRLKERISGKKVLHARMLCTSYLPSWRPGRNHRETYSCYKNQGGGVLLDLSHEIDAASYLFGPIQKIEGRCGRTSDITVDSEDYADLIVSHASHQTSIHLNYFSRETSRQAQVDMEDATARIDYIRGQFFESPGNKTEEIPHGTDEMFISQLRYFFKNLNNPDLDNNLKEAGLTFRKIIEFRNSQKAA